jgi:NDP-sugar pyrophosphorylase family protein
MPGVVVKTIVSLNALSAGDALREIESQQLIKADFILVSGDVVSNMNLQEVLQLHKYSFHPNSIRSLFYNTSDSYYSHLSLENAGKKTRVAS